MNTTVKHDTRTAQVANLRALADFLETHPDLKSPFDGGERFLVCLNWTDDPKAEMAKWARATSHLKPSKDFSSPDYARLLIPFGDDITLEVFADRGQVCEKVITGSQTVTKTVQDPEMLKAVPLVEVTEQVETFEWVCSPLLAVDES